MPERAVDPTNLLERLNHVRGIAQDLYVSLMIYVGRRLGLYDALRGAGPLDSEALAARTGLHERWLREWLRGQAAAGLIDYGDGRFELSLEAAAVLTDEDHLMFLGHIFDSIPHRAEIIQRLPEAFRTGLGLSWDDRGEGSIQSTESTFRNWYRHVLVPAALPLLDGVVPRLQAGAQVADLGCGTGVALIEMAKAFPRSHFHGYEISEQSLARADENRAAARTRNAHLHNLRVEPLPGDAGFDLITTFDCLHDMTDPEKQAAVPIRAALKPDGVWFIVDIDGGATFEENLQKPAAAMLYAMSVLSCMSSSLSEPGAEGLGTLGLPEPALRELVRVAGFTRFRRLNLRHPMNAYYEVRP
ncbi:MAG: class I SAM-dependent methyltransferase [Dehalococcoidia bacterium]